jgi:hypothetical protein
MTTRIGAALHVRRGPLDESGRGDFDIVLGAALTLLSLIVGFSFSMASGRYDQRKTYEEAEANAIGTAYARTDLLPSADALKVQQLLRAYTDLRIRFYARADSAQARDLSAVTNRTQAQLWNAVVAAARAAPTPLSALAAAAMNDTINSQGYAQAAAWNRIPRGAWALLYVLGAVAMAMMGYRFRHATQERRLMVVVPAMVATAFFMIADIDCPNGGVIRVSPENLQALSQSWR